MSQIPKSLCYPYLLSNLANRVKEKGGIDFVTIFKDDELFSEFSSLSDPLDERPGFTFSPIEIQGQFMFADNSWFSLT